MALHPPKTLKQRYHFGVIERYHQALLSATNSVDMGDGFRFTRLPLEPIVSFASLVEMDELTQLDLIFPTVPYKNYELYDYLRVFLTTHRRDIVYCTINPTSWLYPTSGEQPLHLNLWFREVAQSDVKMLIQRIEKCWGSQKTGEDIGDEVFRER